MTPSATQLEAQPIAQTEHMHKILAVSSGGGGLAGITPDVIGVLHTGSHPMPDQEQHDMALLCEAFGVIGWHRENAKAMPSASFIPQNITDRSPNWEQFVSAFGLSPDAELREVSRDQYRNSGR